MSEFALRSALSALDIPVVEFACRLQCSRRTVQRWLKGDTPVPKWAVREAQRMLDDRNGVGR